jgi:hypothetical protein
MLEGQLVDLFHDIQKEYSCCSLKELNNKLDKNWGRKLFAPHEIDHLSVIPIINQNKPQIQIRNKTMVDWDVVY